MKLVSNVAAPPRVRRLVGNYTIVEPVATSFSLLCIKMPSLTSRIWDILARAMNRLPLSLLLICASFPNVVSQSGRRVSTVRTTPPVPVQPPANPEPEPLPSKSMPGPLLFLPEKLLDREIKTLDNGSFRLADFRGKVLVINIWASWCGPCRREVPEYEKVRKAYAGREVEFIGLTNEDPRFMERINRFVRQTGFGFRLGFADSVTARILMNDTDFVPQTLVVNTGGSVVNHWSGYAPGRSGKRLTEAIDSVLKIQSH
jgi:thiol-disulfide isomerase/thioredoxin